MAKKQLNVRVPMALYQKVENADKPKAAVVIEALTMYFDDNSTPFNNIGSADNDNDSIKNNNNISEDDDSSDINLYQLLIDEKEKSILFLQREIEVKNTQIYNFQAEQHLYLVNKTGLIEMVVRKLKLKK